MGSHSNEEGRNRRVLAETSRTIRMILNSTYRQYAFVSYHVSILAIFHPKSVSLTPLLVSNFLINVWLVFNFLCLSASLFVFQ